VVYVKVSVIEPVVEIVVTVTVVLEPDKVELEAVVDCLVVEDSEVEALEVDDTEVLVEVVVEAVVVATQSGSVNVPFAFPEPP